MTRRGFLRHIAAQMTVRADFFELNDRSCAKIDHSPSDARWGGWFCVTKEAPHLCFLCQRESRKGMGLGEGEGGFLPEGSWLPLPRKSPVSDPKEVGLDEGKQSCTYKTLFSPRPSLLTKQIQPF